MNDHTLDVLEYQELKRILLHHAASPLAEQVIEGMRPSGDRERVALSLRQLDEARHLLDTGRPLPVRGLHDMMAPIRRRHGVGRSLDPEDLLKVHDVLVACRGLARFLEEVQEEAPRLHELAGRMLDHGEILRRIEACVEPPGRVRDDASERLFHLRERRRVLEDEIRERMTALATGPRYRAYLRERTFSVRSGRYVLPVILDKKGHVPGILLDKSASGQTAFIEPQEVAVLVNELEDVRLDENREVSRLLLELSRRIYAEETRLAYTQDVAAWLAFTAARASMSAELGLFSAEMSEGQELVLRRVRHPLLVAARAAGRFEREVVPFSLELGRERRMLVITGPNTGGKTVTLKTVGLVQLMFQSGLHVPAAAGTRLPVLREIHADIGDEQSLTQNLSTFSGHVRNMARILEDVGSDTLVLLDELGAGTDPAEGAALGQAILEELRRAGALTVVTTHMGVLKTYGFLHADVENACVTFDPETLEPTFRLLVGQPGNSNALIIARRYGIPASVLETASALIDREGAGTRELVEQLVASRVASEEARERSRDLMEESRRKLAEAERALAEAREARRTVEREAESEVTRLLQEFRVAARRHLNALKNVPKGLTPHVEALEELLRRRLELTPLAARRKEFIRSLKRHDQVFIPRFNQVCRIEKLDRADERMTVRVGGISMEVSFSDVSWVTPPDKL